MGQINFVISIMFITLFSLSIIGFGINFATDNNSAISISDDPELSQLNIDLKNNASSFKEASSSSYTSIVKSSVSDVNTLESGGTFSLTISNVIPTVKNILSVGYLKIFGNNPALGIFLTAFISIIGFLGFMYFVKTWLGRNPE